MRNCFILALVAVMWLALAMAETRIEVDENGDEFELKRFYIQGRQLNGNGSQSQCVVTRRKRSSRSAAPSVNTQRLSVADLAEVEHREGAANVPGEESKRYVDLSALSGVHLNADQIDEVDEFDEDDDDADEQNADEVEQQQTGKKQKDSGTYVPAALALPLAAGAATHLPPGLSVLAEPATHGHVVDDASIVLVQSHQPPKVNPDTHAVFELKPVQAEDDIEEDEEDDNEGDDDYFYYGGNALYSNADGAYDEEFVSELNPVSTTAIWSTGSDEDDAINQKPNKGQRPNRVQRPYRGRPNQNGKPNLEKKKKPQQQQRPQRPNKKPRPTPAVDVDDGDEQDLEDTVDLGIVQSQKKKKQHASESSAVSASTDTNKQRPAKKPRPSSSSTSASVAQKKQKRRRPSSSSSSSSSSIKKRNKKKTKNQKRRTQSGASNPNRRRNPNGSRPVGGYKRRRTQQQKQQQQMKRRRQQQRRRRLQQQRRRRNQNRLLFGDEPIVNCIYINKDPPTTQRPFWNILGREAGDVDDDSLNDPAAEQAVQQAIKRHGDFGQRKRTNLRFVG